MNLRLKKMISNARPVLSLKGVGKKTNEYLEKLGIITTDDLIRYFPRTYEQYPLISTIDSLKREFSERVAILAGPKTPISTIRRGSLVMTQAKLFDDTGSITAVWYHMPYLKNVVTTSKNMVFCGRTVVKNNRFYLEHPLVFTCENYKSKSGLPCPIYSVTSGINSSFIEKLVTQVFSDAVYNEDYLPAILKNKYSLVDRKKAVELIHHPKDMTSLMSARKRIVFDEFFMFLSCLNKNKSDKSNRITKYTVNDTSGADKLISSLPFTLTSGQKEVWNEIKADLESKYCMNRLIEGDVGSGKTVLALLAMKTICDMHWQAALMAPTEVLAVQHFNTIKVFLGHVKDDKTRVLLLTGSMSKSEKVLAHKQIKSHEFDLIIGTHTLIQENALFDDLALVITDEQHRFGVIQRSRLASKGNAPHILVMSATPIPRTLAVILYGDMDISILNTLPGNRIPIKNCVISSKDRKKAYIHILKELTAGRQAYIICPMVDANENIEACDVNTYSANLRKIFGDKVRIGTLHGRMTPNDKNNVMFEFSSGNLDILVSTTVVEVGVDVPNATVIMIEDAQRFGLATLHQLRGRVGRGGFQSYCIFVQTASSELAKKRLDTVSGSNNGFEIAAMDLKLRGPGELFGSAQSGELTFGIGDIYNDNSVLKLADEAAKLIPDLEADLSKHEKDLLNLEIAQYSHNHLLKMSL